jgi:REP element-mobilizing transposase RayT
MLDQPARAVVDAAIREACEHRAWVNHALNVRSNHVHLVVTANTSPERAMADLKAWGTRRLRERGLAPPLGRMWTAHGSTRYLFDHRSLGMAIDYVVRHQDMRWEQ